MELVLSYASKFLIFLSRLSDFMFTPLKDLSEVVFSHVFDDALVGEILEKFMVRGLPRLISLIPAFGELTMAGLLLGGGITVLLLWRLWSFISDGLGL